MIMRAVIYCRVSLDRTGEAASVNRQEKACRALCELKGWDVATVKVDNSISAYDEDKIRPAWDDVLAMADRGEVDVIVAYHLDRMTRSMLRLEELIIRAEKHGVGIATVQGDIDLTTDMGRMVARILAAVARAEVERKAARQRLANEDRATRGLPYTGGSRPFGYTQDGMTIVEAEAAAIRQGALDVINGKTLAQVARDFNSAGLLTTHDREWGRASVRFALLNPRNVSVVVRHGQEYGRGVWPAILDMETYLQVRETLTDPERRNTKDSHSGRMVTNLLSSLARCGGEGCDKVVNATNNRGMSIYACTHRHAAAPRDVLDRHVEKHMIALLSAPKALASLVPSDDKRASGAQRQLDKLQGRLKRIMAANANGGYDDDPDQFDLDLAEIKKSIAEQKAIIAESGSTKAFVGFDFTNVIESWNRATFSAKRSMISSVLDVTVLPRGRHRVPFDPEQHAVVTRRG